MLRVGFTGTRTGMTDYQKHMLKKYLIKHNIAEIHIGDCIGADEETYFISRKLNLYTIIHPPNIDTYRAFCKGDEIREPKPYLDRNKDIVHESNILIATPKEHQEVIRSGTWATIRYARKRGVTLKIIRPEKV